MKHLLLSLLIFLPLASAAQENVGIDSLGQNRVGVVVDAMTFFRDNEYTSKFTDGYSLPGAWVRPTFQYNPNSQIHLELGAHALFFDGANKYPNYAYHDIGTWKGNQYQDGAHVLPWFRAQANMGKVKVVLGNIYGADFHELVTPLYNKEQLLSADPEMGAQILIDTKRNHTDIFLNWQSYQFKEDTHQEAFTVGVTGRYGLGRTQNWGIRYAVLAQHRGGEQDVTDLGVQTLANWSVGADYRKRMAGTISEARFNANLMGCYQQAGKLWPFDTGMAWNVEGALELKNQLAVGVGYFRTMGDFVSVYGNPFFSTLSINNKPQRFDFVGDVYLNLDYHRTFWHNYTFGANAELFLVSANALHECNFSFGLYLRVCPWFRL